MIYHELLLKDGDLPVRYVKLPEGNVMFIDQNKTMDLLDFWKMGFTNHKIKILNLTHKNGYRMLLAVTGGSPAKLRIVTWMLLPSSGHANHPTPFAPQELA